MKCYNSDLSSVIEIEDKNDTRKPWSYICCVVSSTHLALHQSALRLVKVAFLNFRRQSTNSGLPYIGAFGSDHASSDDDVPVNDQPFPVNVPPTYQSRVKPTEQTCRQYGRIFKNATVRAAHALLECEVNATIVQDTASELLLYLRNLNDASLSPMASHCTEIPSVKTSTSTTTKNSVISLTSLQSQSTQPK